MSDLISGKEALIALANGEEVEFKDGMEKWENIKHHMNLDLSMFLTAPEWMKFRLKPRTITINGIEVPACGKNYKPHTYMFVLNSLESEEYSRIILDESDTVPLYWWRTEDEIKQVVEVLRSIFK